MNARRRESSGKNINKADLPRRRRLVAERSLRRAPSTPINSEPCCRFVWFQGQEAEAVGFFLSIVRTFRTEKAEEEEVSSSVFAHHETRK